MQDGNVAAASTITRRMRLHAFDNSLSYGGCPAAVVVHRKREVLVFAPLSGGP